MLSPPTHHLLTSRGRDPAQVLRKLGHRRVARHVQLQERHLGPSRLGARLDSFDGRPPALGAARGGDDGEAVGGETGRDLEADALVGARDDADGSRRAPEGAADVLEEVERRHIVFLLLFFFFSR